MSADKDYEKFWLLLGKMQTSTDLAENIVADIWVDVTDRRGWRQEADKMDYETKTEILKAWLKLARKRIKRK